MARKPSFKVEKCWGGWKVEIPARLSPSGERERAFFRTRDEAKEFAAKLRADYEAHGTKAVTIKPSLAEEATEAGQMLAPFGLSLLDAARIVVQIKKAELASQTAEHALTAFLSMKEGRSDRHVSALGIMKRDFLKDFAGRTLSTITSQEILNHVESHASGPHGFNNRSRLIGAFWRWCARSPRSWCEAKVIEVLEKRETTRSEIGVITAKECTKLLQTAEKHYPDCVPGFAIALFTGIRKSELGRLTPENVTTDGITLSASSTKSNRRRFIEMPAPLAAWLEAYPIGDTVLPANWFRKEKAVRRKAGWRVWCDLFDPPAAPEELPEWPDNALRHTHASVAVALGKPLESLIFEFGHSGGAQVLKSHYVGAMSKAEAIKIWSIGPKGTKLDTIVAA